MSGGSWWSAGVGASAVMALVALASCRPGEGQRCLCEGECRRGLLCAQGGAVLGEGECLDPNDPSPGECIHEEQQDGGEDEAIDEPTQYYDVGSKRDFEPGGGEATTTTTTTDATTSTSSTTGPGTSTSTTDTGSTSSGSTGSGSSETSSGSSGSSGGSSSGSP